MRLALTCTLGVAAVAAGLLRGGGAPAKEPAGAAAPPPATTSAAPVAAPAAAPVAAAAPVVTFPDGSSRPTLNGVTETVALQWPADTAYSPVVETVTDHGTEWFRHADGSWSTTLLRRDEATGQFVTVCPVFQPGPERPVELRGN